MLLAACLAPPLTGHSPAKSNCVHGNQIGVSILSHVLDHEDI